MSIVGFNQRNFCNPNLQKSIKPLNQNILYSKTNQLSFNGDQYDKRKPKEITDSIKIAEKTIVNNIINQLNDENTINPWLHSLFTVLPKAELHAHLRGSRPRRILKEMLTAQGVSEHDAHLKASVNNRFENLTEFVEAYEAITQGCKDPEQLKLATYMICKKAAEDNVKYLPLRIGLAGEKSSPEEILNAVKEGAKLCREEIKEAGLTQKVKIIVGAKRHGKLGEGVDKIVERAMEDVKLAVELRAKDPDKTIVGFDICGDESRYPIDLFKDVIAYAKENDLPVTVHAGETDHSGNLTGAESVEHALDMGVNRLGHALHATDDEKLMNRIRDLGITVEVPPTSNVAIKNATWDNHPIRKMLDKGIKVAICTDDPGLLQTKISKELERLYKHGVVTDWKEIKEIILNGARGSFLPKEEKEELVHEFEKDLSDIENTPQFKNVIDKYLTPTKNVLSFAGRKLGLISQKTEQKNNSKNILA
ncbi:MAG: adenosine deaminase family protein [bacterium]